MALRFVEQYGTTNDDTLSVNFGRITYGFGGNDTLQAVTGVAFAVAHGGTGNDTYVAPSSGTLTVRDGGGSDTLVLDGIGLGFDTSFVATLDSGRHIVGFDEASGQEAIILDWRDPAARIETIQLADTTLTYDFLAANLQQIDGFLGDRSWESFDPGGPTTADIDAAIVFYDAREDQVLAPPMQGATLDLLALAPEQQIAAVYAAYLGRAPDPEGLEFWLEQFAAGQAQGKTQAQLLGDISESFRGVISLPVDDPGNSEGRNVPIFQFPNQATQPEVESFLIEVYDDLFNRAPGAEGLAFWSAEILSRLDQGRNIGDILVNIISGAQATGAGDDIATVLNKAAAGLFYANEVEERGAAWTADDDIPDARAVIQEVGASLQSVTDGQAEAVTLDGLDLGEAAQA